jgi:MSHA pilin protein MshC
MKKTAGFTLIELIVVIMIVSILAVSAVSRFSNQSGFSLKTEQELLIAALFQAQQLALSGRPTQFAIISANSFSVRDSGNPSNHYNVAGITYPQSLNAGVVFSPTSLLRNYSKLGATSAVTINLTAGGDSVSVCLEASGYAHAC